MLFPGILSADETQRKEPKPTELRNQIGLEYNTNYFGNMGNVNYAYKFSKYSSVFANAGAGYLSLEQDSGDGQGLEIFPYPVASVSLKYLW